MDSHKKRFIIFGILALFLLGMAASNSAIIKSLDAAYSQIINSGISNRKAISAFERGSNTIQNTLVNMLLAEDISEKVCLQNIIYDEFTDCDKYLLAIEKSKFSDEHQNNILQLRSSYVAYKEVISEYFENISKGKMKTNSHYMNTMLQKKFTHLLTVVDEIRSEIDYAAANNSTSISRQNNLAMKFITGAGIVPLAFWGLLLIATILGTSVMIRGISRQNR